ncbi:probable disease resistance protein At4g27220 [Camellia sinensis]|uniref:probable disease resistance protein At4g27220 n=1 Tax=Camellia sinensis TaxID=4442 RepID=UPI001036AD80|nr:probable disease resistance protein At4g27220 [Camellia sinensis]
MGHEDMEKNVLPSLKLSYSRLNGTKLKDCFLYCALYPEDCKIPRDELIRYFIAEGLIDRSKSSIRQFDEGHTILNKLERSCLLEHCNNDDGDAYVKMHDLIRDMALKITENRFMVKAGVGLKEIPHLQECAGNLEKVSLMKNNIQEIPCGWSRGCPSLSTLILKDNRLKSIAASFFKHMHALQVLDLSGNSGIRVLPNSISDLVKLTALLLAHCTSLTYVPPLGKLRALEELDLSFTRINRVPQRVDMLVNLKNLNMNGTHILGNIPSRTFTRLSHLQLLRLECTPVQIRAAEELEGLTKLEEIDVYLKDVHSFNVFLKFLQHREVPLGKYILQFGGGSLFEYRS